jgi:ADP-heptose:LPS heptosyltransferase
VEWQRVLGILETYEEGSGHKLNFQKTIIFFSRNTSVEKRQEILQLSRLLEATRYDTYLGLPSLIGKSKMQAFTSIKSRVEKKLSSWKVKFLSQVSKEILLKAVVHAIPTYSMNVFLIPLTLCRKLIV